MGGDFVSQTGGSAVRFRGDGGILAWVPDFRLFKEEPALLVTEAGAVVVWVWGVRRLASI
jgi:hypothetical protein